MARPWSRSLSRFHPKIARGWATTPSCASSLTAGPSNFGSPMRGVRFDSDGSARIEVAWPPGEHDLRVVLEVPRSDATGLWVGKVRIPETVAGAAAAAVAAPLPAPTAKTVAVEPAVPPAPTPVPESKTVAAEAIAPPAPTPVAAIAAARTNARARDTTGSGDRDRRRARARTGS